MKVIARLVANQGSVIGPYKNMVNAIQYDPTGHSAKRTPISGEKNRCTISSTGKRNN